MFEFPRSAAAALARLTGLRQLGLEAGGLNAAVVGSILGMSGLTSLSLCFGDAALPEQQLLQLPHRLPLLAHVDLSEESCSEDWDDADDWNEVWVEDLRLPAPADFPNLRTYYYNFELARVQVCKDGISCGS